MPAALSALVDVCTGIFGSIKPLLAIGAMHRVGFNGLIALVVRDLKSEPFDYTASSIRKADRKRPRVGRAKSRPEAQTMW
jgi:hypothetical protein